MKHTSLYLDEALLAEAAEALGTNGPTSTVRAALEEAVRRRRLESIAQWSTDPETALVDWDVLARVRSEAWGISPNDS